MPGLRTKRWPIRPRAAARGVRLLAALLLSSGCAQLPVETGPADFRVEGKVGVLEGERSHSARFVWRQTGDRYDIVLWGPLGQGSTRLRGDSDRIEITGRNAGPALSGEPGVVMRRQLGWSLPLAVLPWWMSGRPAPDGGVEASEHDEEGRLTAFRQLGWQVKYDRFEARGDRTETGRVTAERPGYRVRVTILSR
ncbi:MAG: lipoprotein insertase outer membrane protein LolB [Gammaproteobacteria bacterium]|nr:lipoprotein insertase outer membrane protein LolB [Gammaproteobacteria bacterium]